MIREFAIAAGARMGLMSSLTSFAVLGTSPGFFSVAGSENAPGMAVLVLPDAVRLVIVTSVAVAGLVLPEICITAIWASRGVKKWGGPLLTLMGVAFLAVPAVFFPSRARRRWLGEVLEGFAYRQDHGINWFMVLASYVRTWPFDLLDEWLTHLKRRPDDLGLADGPAGDAFTGQRPGFWRRHRTEIILALLFALIFSPPGAICYEIATEWLHHHGYEWVWE